MQSILFSKPNDRRDDQTTVMTNYHPCPAIDQGCCYSVRRQAEQKIEPLCELLLSISRSRNDYLVMSAFEIFEVIFQSMTDEVSASKLPRLLESIVELKPGQKDSQLLPPWIAVVSRGYGTAAEVEPEDTFAKLPELFDLISAFLTNSSHNIRISASECLISFCANCIPDSVISDPSVYDEKVLEQTQRPCS